MRLPGAQRAAETDLTDALFDRNQHDVHDPYAADAQRHRPDKEEQRFDANGDAFHDRLELFPAEHGDGALVIRREVLAISDGGAELLHRLSFKYRSDRLEDHHAGILGVPKIVGGGVRDEGGFVVAIEITTVGELHVHGADDSKRHAFDAHGLADGGLTAEEFLAKAGAKENHAAAFDNVFRRNPTAVGRHFVAHFAVFRKHAADGGTGEALAVRNTLEANRFPGDALDQRRLGLHPFGIFFLEADRLASAFTARLLAGGAGPGNDRALPENFERIHEHTAKARAIAEQECDRDYSPRNAGHRQEAANGVAAKGGPRLFEDFGQHQPPASKRRASIGSTEAARFRSEEHTSELQSPM